MITVTFPEGFLQERLYAVHVLLYEFLGLEYDVDNSSKTEEYVFSFEKKQIRIRDAFFGAHRDGIYLKEDSIPQQATSAKQSDLENIICIYGDDTFSEDPSWIQCGVDIIAGTFFMLTRWEEFVLKTRDKHGRFPGTASLAMKSGFLHRPVVNEYARLLKKWLLRIGVPEQSFKQRTFSLSLQCDVDTALYYPPGSFLMRKFLFRLLKERSVSGAFSELKEHKDFRRLSKDPYDTYDHIMDLAERHGAKAAFCFLVAREHALDSAQTIDKPHVKQIFERIRSRGHDTGVHFSYRTADETYLFPKEMQQFEKHAGQKAQKARQHFLRCSVPQTWRGWEEAGLLCDYSMGYPESAGFRCGTCYPFPLFDVENCRMLEVYERPLIAMDVTFRMYRNASPDEAIAECRKLMEIVKEHQGEFVFLWHNSSFALDWKEWKDVPQRILETQGKLKKTRSRSH